MARNEAMRLTRLEHDLLEVLWSLGRASIREIHEAIPVAKRGAYTTVQTIVARLEEKGAVRRVRKIGNAYIFEPAITRHAVRRHLVKDLLERIGGPRPLMAHLVETGELGLEDLQELERMVRSLEDDSRGGRRK